MSAIFWLRGQKYGIFLYLLSPERVKLGFNLAFSPFWVIDIDFFEVIFAAKFRESSAPKRATKRNYHESKFY